MMAEIKKVTKSIAKTKRSKRQAAMMRNLQILKSECERNTTTAEEVEFYQQFVALGRLPLASKQSTTCMNF